MGQGIRIPVTGMYRIYHMYGDHYSSSRNDGEGGLAIVHPWYEILTPKENASGGGVGFARKFQEGDIVVFRSLPKGVDEGSYWDSTGSTARVTLQGEDILNWGTYQYQLAWDKKMIVAHIGWDEIITSRTYQTFSDRFTILQFDYEGETIDSVVGGPIPEWRWTEDSVRQGANIQRGWKRGKRNGYADGEWISYDLPVYDETNVEFPERPVDHGRSYIADDAAFIECFDSEWALGVYFVWREVGSTEHHYSSTMGWYYYSEGVWTYQNSAEVVSEEDLPADLSYSSTSYEHAMRVEGTLFRREGDALITVTKHIDLLPGDWNANFSSSSWAERLSLYLNRISDTEMVLSYDQGVAWNPADPDEVIWPTMWCPAIAVLRRVGETVEHVTSHLLLDRPTMERYWEPEWKGTFMVAPLSRTKWAVLHTDVFKDEAESLDWRRVFFERGDEHFYNWSEYEHVAAVSICEWDGQQGITQGERTLVGYDWYSFAVTAVNESMVAVAASYDNRWLRRDSAQVRGNLYNGSGFIHTLSIDGLVATAHPETGWSDTYTDPGYYYWCPRVASLNGGKQLAVTSLRSASAQDAIYEKFDNVHVATTPESYIDRRLGSSSQTRGHMPVVHLLDVSTDGALSVGGRVAHSVDGSGLTRYFDTYLDTAKTRPTVRASYPQIDHIQMVGVSDDTVLVNWNQRNTTYGNPNTPDYYDPLDEMEKGAFLTLDPSTASGFSQNGFRHLGVMYNEASWTQDASHRINSLRRFPGTDFYVAWCGPWSEESSDGSLADVRAEWPGFPTDFFQHQYVWVDGGWWKRWEYPLPESGLYWTPNYYARAEVVGNDWAYLNIEYAVEKYGIDPWDIIYDDDVTRLMDLGAPIYWYLDRHWQDGSLIWAWDVWNSQDTLNFSIWEMPADRLPRGGRTTEVKVKPVRGPRG